MIKMDNEDYLLKHLNKLATTKTLNTKGSLQAMYCSSIEKLHENFKRFMQIKYKDNPEIKYLFCVDGDFTRLIIEVRKILGLHPDKINKIAYQDIIKACNKTIELIYIRVSKEFYDSQQCFDQQKNFLEFQDRVLKLIKEGEHEQ